MLLFIYNINFKMVILKEVVVNGCDMFFSKFFFLKKLISFVLLKDEYVKKKRKMSFEEEIKYLENFGKMYCLSLYEESWNIMFVQLILLILLLIKILNNSLKIILKKIKKEGGM